MKGTKWNQEERVINRKTQAEKQRLLEIQRALSLSECPVRYICIGCQRNEQANRKDRKCSPCITSTNLKRANGNEACKLNQQQQEAV